MLASWHAQHASSFRNTPLTQRRNRRQEAFFRSHLIAVPHAKEGLHRPSPVFLNDKFPGGLVGVKVSPLLDLVLDWKGFLNGHIPETVYEEIRTYEGTGRPLGSDLLIDKLEAFAGMQSRKK